MYPWSKEFFFFMIKGILKLSLKWPVSESQWDLPPSLWSACCLWEPMPSCSSCLLSLLSSFYASVSTLGISLAVIVSCIPKMCSSSLSFGQGWEIEANFKWPQHLSSGKAKEVLFHESGIACCRHSEVGEGGKLLVTVAWHLVSCAIPPKGNSAYKLLERLQVTTEMLLRTHWNGQDVAPW